jgi:hypothetical protein
MRHAELDSASFIFQSLIPDPALITSGRQVPNDKKLDSGFDQNIFLDNHYFLAYAQTIFSMCHAELDSASFIIQFLIPDHG